MSQVKKTLDEVILIPMVEGNFQRWFDNCTEEYAEDKQKTHGCTIQAAREFAQSSMSNYLADGLNTPDNYFFSAIDKQGEEVGTIWFAIQTNFEQSSAFLYDIKITDNKQGQGYGRATMSAFEREVAKLGIDRINLHVFAFNEKALSLYKSLGFQVTDYTMRKRI